MNVNAMPVGNYEMNLPTKISVGKEGEKKNSEFNELVRQVSSNEPKKESLNMESVVEKTDDEKECVSADFEKEKSNLLQQSLLVRNMIEVIPMVFVSENMAEKMPVFLKTEGTGILTQQIPIVAENAKHEEKVDMLEIQANPMTKKTEQSVGFQTIHKNMEGLSQGIKNAESSNTAGEAAAEISIGIKTMPLVSKMEEKKIPVEETKLTETKLPEEVQKKKNGLQEENAVVLSMEESVVPQKEVIVIKVGENTQIPMGEKLAEKLGEKIVVNLKADDKEFHAILKPEGLGSIDVKMRLEDGKVFVSIVCNNENTKDLLNKNIYSLARIIETNLGQTPVVTVFNEKESGQEQQQGTFDGQGKGQYQDQSEKNKREENPSELEFVQRLRLGMVEQEEAIA